MIQILVQFHCLSSYGNDLYRNDQFPFRPMQRFSSDWDDRDGQVNCTEIRIHTSGDPIIEYMRKKWKYCCKWRPCSGTSFFNRPSTAVKIWSLSVALLSSSVKQTNNLSITTNRREFWAKTRNRSNIFSRCHIRVFVAWLGNPNYCSRLRLTCDKRAISSSCSHLHWHKQRMIFACKAKCKLWQLLICDLKE